MPLGHDEARYAIEAKDWLAGEQSRFIYSGAGMQAYLHDTALAPQDLTTSNSLMTTGIIHSRRGDRD